MKIRRILRFAASIASRTSSRSFLLRISLSLFALGQAFALLKSMKKERIDACEALRALPQCEVVPSRQGQCQRQQSPKIGKAEISHPCRDSNVDRQQVGILPSIFLKSTSTCLLCRCRILFIPLVRIRHCVQCRASARQHYNSAL